MNIQLNIERLILDGVTLDPAGRRVFQAVATAELTRLLTRSGIRQALLSGGAIPELPAGTIQLSDHQSPFEMGASFARALYRGLGKSGGQ